MATKNAFDRGVLTINSQAFGVVDIRLSFTRPEIEVTDTETTSGTKDYVAPVHEVHQVSFKAYHVAKTAMLNRGSAYTGANWQCVDSAGDWSKWTGDLIIYTAELSGSQEGAVEVQYTGQITGAFAETQKTP